MGCHTWFYKKINITYEEVLSSVILSFEKNIEWWNEFIKDKESDYIIDLIKSYPYINDTHAARQIEISYRKIRMIKAGYCKEAVCEKYTNVCANINIARYIKGKGMFIAINTQHDVFRKYGYPDDTLFSYDETIKYIGDPVNECQLYTSLYKTKKQLKKFWDKYPDGMIDFG